MEYLSRRQGNLLYPLVAKLVVTEICLAIFEFVIDKNFPDGPRQ
jgi:hypothetical protein